MNVTENPDAFLTTPFQMLQWKAAVNLEGRGLKHSRGRSVTAHVKRTLGLRARLPRDEVIEHLEAAIASCAASAVPPHATVELERNK